MKKYTILFGEWITDLETRVDAHMVLGWTCQGGVCVVSAFSGSGYYQAMVLDNEEAIISDQFDEVWNIPKQIK